MIVFLFLAALIWGVTNPFLKRYSAGMKQGGTLKEDLNHLVRRPGYLCVQLINLSGSLVFFYALREVEVSIGSVVANSLTFVITLLTSSFILCEGALRIQTVIGCSLVLIGTALCTVFRTGG
ncbi:unnamed protein product [Phytomonas sp. EM1]|nr:unnamed protein product [Phytomonas sp. EM1]|eukprot:CCW65081.1 unnamed protein product [Phytomonas sp. isolate EM1]